MNPFLIHIGNYGDGYCNLFIDTSTKNEDGDSPVLIYGVGVSLQDFAPSFVDCLRKFSDEKDPMAGVVKEPSGSRPEPEPREDEEEKKPRSMVWLEAGPGTFATEAPPISRFFGIDEDTMEVFIHAQTVRLDVEQQMEAMEGGEGFFANPTNLGGFAQAFVSIDHLIENHAELAESSHLAELKDWIIDAYDQAL